jgi:MIP family channel proteins
VRAHVAEAVGTFALVFIGCGAIAVTAQTGGPGATGIALAFGLVIGVMIYALGHVSGAHFNPAVSAAFALGGHLSWTRAATYAIAQVAGALAGAWLLRATLGPDADLGVTQPSGSDGQALVWEATLTFFLVLVITAVATDSRAVGEAAALAIGGAVAMGALVGGPVSGASMNPARSIGPAVIAADLTSLWVYMLGPLAGAAAAVALYRFVAGGRVAYRPDP